MRVAIQESTMVNLLRVLDHSNGEVYFLRSGCGGGGAAADLLDRPPDGRGNRVSKVR